MNCAQVQERLIDFLYGDLPAPARDLFAEHLQGCPACKAEVASYQRTLGSARIALGGPLNDEPPARVHLAVVEAAKAAAKTNPRVGRDELGFFARLWRTPWLLPAFGAASVATVVFLVRVLKNPEVLPGQHPHSIEERALSTPEPVAAPAATLAPKPAAIPAAEVKAKEESDRGRALAPARGMGKRAANDVPSPIDTPTVHAKGKKAISNDPLSGLNLGEGPSSSGGLGRFAEPPPLRQAVSKSSGSLDDLLDEVREQPRERESPQRRAQPSMAPAGGKADRNVSADQDRLDGMSEIMAAPAKKAPRPEPVAEMAKPAVRSIAQPAGTPAAAAASSYAPVPAAAPSARPVRDYPAAQAAETAPSAPLPVVRHRGEKQAEKTLEDSAQADGRFLAKDKAAKGESKAGPTLDESVRKAERLYASQDWNAAAAAYSDLLNRFPSHKDAPKWRNRMNESNDAYQRALEAKRKKVLSDDPLSGSKR
jgi:anti-sigma factor RsiW